jgi:putative membrane protein
VANPSRQFSSADRERVNLAVRDAESVTDAEIVPVVAQCSGRYDRPEDIVGLWLAALALICAWLLLPLPSAESGNWGTFSPLWHLVALLVAVTVGFIVGAAGAARVDWLRRWFAPRKQMREEVFARARAVFFDNRVHHTSRGAGVLLYVSLFERMAAVIADQKAFDKLGQEQIDAVCRELTDRLRSGPPIDALCQTVDSLGQRLAAVLPRSEGTASEISDALVVIE